MTEFRHDNTEGYAAAKMTTQLHPDLDVGARRSIANFPLPSQNATAAENYRRVLDWLYDGGANSPASLVIELTRRIEKGV
jgi:hypothetical protein